MRARLMILAVLSLALASATLPNAQEHPSNAFFDDSTLQRLELWVNDTDWEKLKRNFRENDFYPADVVRNGQRVRNGGIRSRGLGSRSGTKPGIRYDCNHYQKQECFGEKAFVLDNLVQDPSTIHDTVAMKVFSKMGVPAPREAHVRLYKNGEYVGLYALVEEVNKELLARVFGTIGEDTQNDGHLYEYKYQTDQPPWLFTYFGSDLAPYKLRFKPETHESESDEKLYRRIEQIVKKANELPSDRYLEELDPLLDLRAFIRYQAVQNFVGENDGFVGYAGMNNFYFYRKENSEQHVFIAWDEDNAFWGPEYPLTLRHEENVLMRKAMEVPELRDLYYQVLTETQRLADTPPEGSQFRTGWLEQEIRRQLELVNDAIREDPVKPYSYDEHVTQRNAMIQYATERGRYVTENVPR
jgi:spore coat protein CotH